MADPGLPLTTGEGISAERLAEIRYEAERLLRAKFRLVDQAEDAVGKSVLELLVECGRLREQLDAARQALEDIAAVKHDGSSGDAKWMLARARAALGVEGPAG